MSGYEVVLHDLEKASRAFVKEAEAYKNMMPRKLACPRGGDNTIDKMLDVSLLALFDMHNVLAEALGAHAEKLDYGRRNYKFVEDQGVNLFDYMMQHQIAD